MDNTEPISPCPRCNSSDVSASGDDFDADCACNECGLSTYICYGGTANAVHIWNNKIKFEFWTEVGPSIEVEKRNLEAAMAWVNTLAKEEKFHINCLINQGKNI